MRPYALIDLHCDTLTDCMYAGSNIIDTLDDPARTLSLTSIPKDIHWAQFFAVFVPDELRGEKAVRFFDDACANFDRQMQKFADRVSPCRNVADMELWGDRIFEKCGIGRDEGGDGGKTLEIRGKRRLSARDGGANYQQS